MKKIKYFILLCCINFSFASEDAGFFEQWFLPDPGLFIWTVITFLIVLGIILGGITFYFCFVEGFGFRPLLYLVVLLETVGFLLVGFGFIAEMIANLREEVRSLRNDSR